MAENKGLHLENVVGLFQALWNLLPDEQHHTAFHGSDITPVQRELLAHLLNTDPKKGVEYLVYELKKAKYTIREPIDPNNCEFCKKPATWQLLTQFSGTIPHCDEHAQEDANFGKEDPSYFFWRKIEKEA